MNETISTRWHLLFDPNRFFGSLALGIAGGIAGGAAAGIAARASMRGVALLSGQTPGFSVGGSLFVIFAGIIVGVLAGMVYGIVLPVLPGALSRKGLFFGGALALFITLIVLFVELEGEIALVSKWAVIALFASLPLIYGPTMGWVTSRLIPQEGDLKAESPPFARTAGLLTVIFALAGAISETVLAVTHPSILNLGYDMANFLSKVAGGAVLLMVFTGIAGLMRSGAAGKSAWAKFGLGFTLLLVALLGFGTAYEGLNSMELHGLVRLIARLEFSNNPTLLVVMLIALAIFGVILAGIAALRTRRWGGWQRYVPLLAGLFPFVSVLLLHPSLFPALLGLSIPGRAQLGHWVAALFALCWLALGIALRVETGPRALSRNHVLEPGMAQ